MLAAAVVALTVGVVAHLLHVDRHEGHETTTIGQWLHWLRDSALAIPLAAAVVAACDRIIHRRAGGRPVLRRVVWAALVSLGYTVALVPGGLAHGVLFSSEGGHGDPLRHAVSDAVALLPTALYTALAIAIVMGAPSDRVWPVATAWRRAPRWSPARPNFARWAAGAMTVALILPALSTPAEASPLSRDGAVTSAGLEQTAGVDAAPQDLAVEQLATSVATGLCPRTITADVVALDQPYFHNRLGAINANGMIYALARDVVVNSTGQMVSDPTVDRSSIAGQVSLRADKRARPLTLRANEGDCLEITFTNLLAPQPFKFNLQPFPFGDLDPDEPFPLDKIAGFGVPINPQVDDQPFIREASIHVDGLELVPDGDADPENDISSDGSNVGQNGDAGNGLVAPGQTTTYTYFAPNNGTHLLYSMGSTFGGEGNGGTRSFGLFGAVNVQPGPKGSFRGSQWYRSQLTREEMDWAASAWTTDEAGNVVPTKGNVPVLVDGTTPRVLYAEDGQPMINYHAVYPAGAPYGKAGLPIVKILDDDNEIVHSDLNAIIDDRGYPYSSNQAYPTRGEEPYREFTVIFHDEAAGVQAFPGFYNDPVLKHTLHGVSDGFPINYGSGGIGSEIIANRLGVGPMWDCAECKYEEFFLTSFTVGDPAMIVDKPANTTDGTGNIIPGAKATKALYPDDPSNVHHAYLGDRVVFRNLHAGPKEHHIFHLHAHQWQFNPNESQSAYLDGQALGPGSGYTYEIAYGGSGNRNKTPGDSIFHCHFYPHFAQGMWELWRVHDTFERGTLMKTDHDGLPIPAPGSRALPDGEIAAGTPIPAVVPMPGIAMAPMPDAAATIVASDLNGDTFLDSSQFDANGDGTADYEQMGDLLAGKVTLDNGDVVDLTNPGYPWFTPGVVGHRPPTPAKDLLDDGGLPRHVITSGPDEDNLGHGGPPVEQYVTRLDFNKVLHEASAIEIPEAGTAAEQTAMEFHAKPVHTTALPVDPRKPQLTGETGEFETNGRPAAPGAPFADPCRQDLDQGLVQGPDGKVHTKAIPLNRWLKGANIEMPVTMNKIGWHFQQQRFEALWEDVVPTLTEQRAPQPMVMRLNSTDCAEFWHTNLVPNVYQLDDYQVRTPTDIIGQHIHLVKFDVMAADGSANGWNYEDGTLSPDEVRERIEAFNKGGGFTQLDGTVNTALEPEAHPFFCKGQPAGQCVGPTGQNWLGARTTIQRWYADPLLERSWDGGVGTVFTHDHYGPSTHQQVGLYSTLLVEPEGSQWFHNETGEVLGGRHDGGPSGWQAIIKPGPTSPNQNWEPHREFYFEFADFQHAYEQGHEGLHPQANGAGVDIPSYADFDKAINPSVRQKPGGNPEDIYLHPNACPGEVQRPCPEAISADDPGTYVLNFRNEPTGARVFNGKQGPAAGQTPGAAGDLALIYQSRTDRAMPELNQAPTGQYPPLTAPGSIQPGDPWTPTMRTYMGDKVRIRVQVGAHEEEHNFTIPGLKWRQDPNDPNSGWRNSEFFGIDEYFNLDVPVPPITATGTPNQIDYVYTVGAELEGTWNGVWGLLRSYGSQRGDLKQLQPVGKGGYAITNGTGSICPTTDADVSFEVTAVRARDVLNRQGKPRQPGDDEGWLVYNNRETVVNAPAFGIDGAGPLIDPTALMYVRTEDVIFDDADKPVGLRAGTPVEPLILRARAGDCIEVNLRNALPADLSDTEMPGYNALPPIIHKNHDADGNGGITSFNANDLTPSSHVGLTPQLLAVDPRDSGTAAGTTAGKLVAPGQSGKFRWYAGDVTIDQKLRTVRGNKTQFTLKHTPVEFGAIGLMPADRIKGTENGLVGAMVIEPMGSMWVEDPGTRAQATVTNADGTSFRDFVTVLQNDLNLRWGGGECAKDPAKMATLACAVPNIAAEGPLGPPEDPQDSGLKAVNYGSDPLWYRIGVTPDTPFGELNKKPELATKIRDVFSNDRVGGDPQVPVFAASPDGPQQGRFRVVMPGGHARGSTWTLHGHNWQRQPYVDNSSKIGNNEKSQYYGAQEGVNPSGHWDFVVDLGGRFDVPGDYLWRDQASFGSYQGLWGLLRYDDTPPVARDLEVEVAKYGTNDIDLLAAAFDLDGDATRIEIVDPPPPPEESATRSTPFGTLTDDGNGIVTYESTAWPGSPSAAADRPVCDDPLACTDSFTYQVIDAKGLVSKTGTVTLTVTNSAPVAVNDTIIISGQTSGAVDVLANDVDADGDLDPARQPVVEVTGPPTDRDGNQRGTVVLDGRTLTYTPPVDPVFVGVAVIPYTVTDESGATSDVGLVRAAVNVDDITITAAQFQPQNGMWTITGTCTDPFLADGTTPTTITAFFGPTIEGDPPVIGSATCIAGDPVGTWSFSGQSANPELTTPDPDAFNYVSAESAKEGFAEAAPARFAGQNNPPTATSSAHTTDEDTPLVGKPLTAQDADFDPLQALLVTDAAHGTVVLNADLTFTYTPDADYAGTDSFVFQVDDGKDLSNEATVTIQIDAVNDEPLASDDAYATAAGTDLTVPEPGILVNDVDVEGDVLELRTPQASGPAHGSLNLAADGSFTYTPNGGSVGTDSFTYVICETATPDRLCGQATVTISVGLNGPPVASGDAYEGVQNTDLVVGTPGVLANDTDPDDDPLTATLVAGPTNGALTLSADGSFAYKPTFNFVGTDSFTYTASDGPTQSGIATVSLRIVDRVAVTSAEYRIRQSRWSVTGTVSAPTSTVDLYLGTGTWIGTANVDNISGAWSFNARNSPVPAAGDTLTAKSTGGGVSTPVTVVIRGP